MEPELEPDLEPKLGELLLCSTESLGISIARASFLEVWLQGDV